MDSIALLRQELYAQLEQPVQKDDPISRCGTNALFILKSCPDEVMRLAHARLHAFPFKDVPECWRRLYCDAALWKVFHIFGRLEVALKSGEEIDSEQVDALLDETVELLDMALIMTGAPRRVGLVSEILTQLLDVIACLDLNETDGDASRSKRRRLNSTPSNPNGLDIPNAFPISYRETHPPLMHPIPRVNNITLPAFQTHLTTSHNQNSKNGSLPLIVTNSITHWPALTSHCWSNPHYLLSKTIGGRRIVPVEIGRSYTDARWSQRLLTVRDFMAQNMFRGHIPPSKRGYLAQHDVFAQIPALREDVCIPDYCYSEPPRPAGDSVNGQDNDEPLLNAWFGPAHTVSPAHTDPHHNILAQVVGFKYVRLFPPSESCRLYPRGKENGIDMSNTSQVDVGLGMRLYEGWKAWDRFDVDDESEDCGGSDEEEHASCMSSAERLEIQERRFAEAFPEFKEAKFVEGILGPGDCLYIPKGWWHYVRGLSPSFSVSFWWD